MIANAKGTGKQVIIGTMNPIGSGGQNGAYNYNPNVADSATGQEQAVATASKVTPASNHAYLVESVKVIDGETYVFLLNPWGYYSVVVPYDKLNEICGSVYVLTPP